MAEAQKWWILILVAGSGVLLYLLAPVLTPFLIAGLLAYLGHPFVVRLEQRGLSRNNSTLTVFSVISLLVLMLPIVIIPLLERQVGVFVNNWPGYVDWVQRVALPWAQQHIGFGETLNLELLKQAFVDHWRQVGGTAIGLVAVVSRSGLAVLEWMANLVLIPVVTFYLLRDWGDLIEHLRSLLPRAAEPKVCRVATDCDEVLGTFMRGQLSVMLALTVIYTVGLWMVGLDLAFLIGLLAGIVSFVPYLGLIVGIVVAGTASIVQVHDLSLLLFVIAVFGVGQLLEGFVLTPWLVGERIGLHPVMVIFSVMAGGQLFGFFGILLALPVSAVLVVLLRYAHDQYLESNIYGADEVMETNVAAVSETIGEAVVGTTEATVSETAENKVE
ncbi:Putative permease often clustered with de novo purine synthesis [hydrothermal vent metagenome]|uniref:Permease often clustered with de novo purine synthesis n=1 Tax=hydrothermal vent metagenome TaxID=652676 RepID=A0A3B0Z004_9ZZZZ